MVEMAATKWVKETPALVVSSLLTHIPVEVASELDIRYCDNIASLEAEILKIVA
jgi:hypothetical protein